MGTSAVSTDPRSPIPPCPGEVQHHQRQDCEDQGHKDYGKQDHPVLENLSPSFLMIVLMCFMPPPPFHLSSWMV